MFGLSDIYKWVFETARRRCVETLTYYQRSHLDEMLPNGFETHHIEFGIQIQTFVCMAVMYPYIMVKLKITFSFPEDLAGARPDLV